jgi:MFS superfamily sulfate permease-like transporter
VAPARAGATLGAGPPAIPCLGLSISLATGQAQRLADSIVDRVLSCGGPVGTVVLDVRSASGIDAGSRAALLSLHGRLSSLGTQLRIATARRQLAGRLGEADRLGEAGLLELLGPDAIHESFRSAVLAAYAALPGPGLVTAQVRAALDTPIEPVDS